MLHILLLILKIIGIALLAIIGLILLVILLILFVPVRYRGEGRGKQLKEAGTVDDTEESQKFDLYAMGKITWLLHFVSLTFEYCDGIRYKLQILGIPFMKSEQEDETGSGEDNSKKKKKNKKKEESKEDQDYTESAENIESTENNKDKENSEDNEEKENEKTDNDSGSQDQENGSVTNDNKDESTGNEEKETSADEENKEQDELKQDEIEEKEDKEEQEDKENKEDKKEPENDKEITEDKEQDTGKKDKKKKEKKKDKKEKKNKTDSPDESEEKQSVVEKIKNIYNKVTALLDDRKVKRAYELVKVQLVRLIKAVVPKKTGGYAKYGFENPAVTGYITAFLAAEYGRFRKLDIEPHFEDEILEGELTFKGRIFMITMLCIGLKVYFSKDVKYTVKKLKEFKGDSPETTEENHTEA